MSHVEPCSCFGGKLYGCTGGLIASLFRPYLGMMDDGRIGAVHALRLLHVAVYDVGVLAMCHDGKGGSLEERLQHVALVDEHVARAGAHKELYARHTVRIDAANGVDVVVSGTDEEAVIDVRTSRRLLHLIVQSIQGGGLRFGVGHVEVRCDAAVSGCTALSLNVSLLCQARVAEMHMVVNHSG